MMESMVTFWNCCSSEVITDRDLKFGKEVKKKLTELWWRWSGGGGILPWETYKKTEYEGIGTCARIEIRQDADNTNQKVKWFLKVHET